MRLMIVVTHLLGTGHLVRAAQLARAAVAAGQKVTLVSGGLPVPHLDLRGLDLVQLPPLRSDGVDFSTLLTAHGTVATAEFLAERTTQLCETLHRVQPDALITELFPFGRRSLRTEFEALLDAARPTCPLIAASVRDILAPPSKQAKADYADRMVSTYYDTVLVHSDETLVPLSLSWPDTEAIRCKLSYTGFVAPPTPEPATRGNTVLVSAGGGSVGDAVFAAALGAAAQTPDVPWHLMVGGDEARRAVLRSKTPKNVTIEPPQPDFRDRMARCAVSISMCGYNTAIDVLQTGTPAVLIPFDDGGEVEQGLRAQALAALSGIAVIPQQTLTAARLTAALSEVRGSTRAAQRSGMDGAAETARLLHQMWQAKA